jgi:hypothetical protein
MRIEEGEKIICEVYDGTIYPRDKNTIVFESSQISEIIWVFC